MLRRLWLSAAVIVALSGPFIATLIYALGVLAVEASLFQGEADTALVTPSESLRLDSCCWLSKYGGGIVVHDIKSSPSPYDDSTTRITAADCLEWLTRRTADLQSTLAWDWLWIVLSATLIPLAVFGVYRWGLWIAGPAVRDDEAIILD
jgi:hypothetical protein